MPQGSDGVRKLLRQLQGDCNVSGAKGTVQYFNYTTKQQSKPIFRLVVCRDKHFPETLNKHRVVSRKQLPLLVHAGSGWCGGNVLFKLEIIHCHNIQNKLNDLNTPQQFSLRTANAIQHSE